ncbi:MAG: hypothetical protein AAGF91_13435 [Actinomycetota bacterium]
MTTADIIELPLDGAASAAAHDAVEAEQLRLGLTTADGRPLRPSRVHARFRLDATTRERGLRHIAEIRARLADGAVGGDDGVDADIVELPRRIRPGQRAS